MKKHTLKKQNGTNIKEKGLWVIIILLVAAQIVSMVYIARMKWSLNGQSKILFDRLINSTEEERYKSPVIDVSESRVYIPEARIYLPLNEVTRDVRYDFRNMEGTEALYFSLPMAIGRQIEEDDHRCDKMVTLTKEKSVIVSEQVGEVAPTKDGLTYVSRHPACQIYADSFSKDLAAAVMQLQSY